ncbi:hypothetical protein ACJX0J_017825 [Zea mays]
MGFELFSTGDFNFKIRFLELICIRDGIWTMWAQGGYSGAYLLQTLLLFDTRDLSIIHIPPQTPGNSITNLCFGVAIYQLLGKHFLAPHFPHVDDVFFWIHGLVVLLYIHHFRKNQISPHPLTATIYTTWFLLFLAAICEGLHETYIIYVIKFPYTCVMFWVFRRL